MNSLAASVYNDRLIDRVVVKIEVNKEAEIVFLNKYSYKITPDKPLDIVKIREDDKNMDKLFSATACLPEHINMKGVVLSRFENVDITTGVEFNFLLDDNTYQH